MGQDAAQVQVHAWLRGGGLVVASSERAARAVSMAYHRLRQGEGLTGWPAPAVQSWEEFVRQAWQERVEDHRLLLNRVQEQALWARIVASDPRRAAWLEGPIHRVARLAMEAHRLLCLYAPKFQSPSARASWQQDAGVFSDWLKTFDEACLAGGLISASRVGLDLIERVKNESARRPGLMLSGFARLVPTQRDLLAFWGQWREAPRSGPAVHIDFHQAADDQAELAACAQWCHRYLMSTPEARVMVVTQDAETGRGTIERALRRFAGTFPGPQVEFSLGVPLGQVTLARGALLVLRWLEASIEEPELDWLLSTGQIAAGEAESRALRAFMRVLRRLGWQRTDWRLEDLIGQRPGVQLPSSWTARMRQASRRLREFSAESPAATHSAWAQLVLELLELANWPGPRPLTSAEFQVFRKWREVLDECASLGYEGRRIGWNDFLKTLDRTVNETLFAPESEDAPILIAGPAESAGLTADAIWFLGASEERWPASGPMHPLLPVNVQRNAAMPHSSAQLDWDVAAAVTESLLGSAPEVHFSCARLSAGAEARPSRLIAKIAGKPGAMPPEWAVPTDSDASVIAFEDTGPIPFSGGQIRGGSNLLTAQSQCPFKAFATVRLGAEEWTPAEPVLTPAQRGELLHALMHAIWAGPPAGICSHGELLEIPDLHAFVQRHASNLFKDKLPEAAAVRMPQRYLELEQRRLTHLVTEWLALEAARVPFSVEGTEVDAKVSIGDLTLKLRLDRLDRLSDGTLLVIDYKSGEASAKSWELPRPENVQLPLYAGFALDPDQGLLGGLVFAKVRAGRHEFAGRLRDARITLKRDLHGSSGLVRSPLGEQDLDAWRRAIEALAADFLAGRAQVNPRQYPKTCQRCGLETLCRVAENPPQSAQDAGQIEETSDV
jgi:ATP-dependent helicase/nuclease subunit B